MTEVRVGPPEGRPSKTILHKGRDAKQNGTLAQRSCQKWDPHAVAQHRLSGELSCIVRRTNPSREDAMPKKPSLMEKVSRGATPYLGNARGHPFTISTQNCPAMV
jgi:hypothetical protein